MKPEIINAKSYVAAFDDCISRIKRRKVELGRRTVVIVPDKYTLYAERRLFAGGGAFDVEALTFSRLLSKTGYRPDGYISRFGAVMLLRRLIGDGEDLECFRRSVRFTGFADAVYDTISQLEASAVSPGELREAAEKSDNPAFKAKISDIAKLFDRYEKEKAGKYTDAAELLKALPDALKRSGYLDGATVYILNFDRFTAAHLAAVRAVAQRASRTFVYETETAKECDLAPRETEVYSAPDFESELCAAASRIRNEVYETGARFSDFCIVAANADFATVDRVMGDFGIRFELDAKYPLSLHPSARFLFAALDASNGRLSREKLIALARCALSGISEKQCADFENYCNRRRIEYKGFLSPFVGEKKEPFVSEERTAENVRVSLVDLVSSIRERLEPQMSADAFAELCERILLSAKGLENLASPYDIVAFEDGLRDTVRLMREIMGGKRYSAELLSATLKEGIDARSTAFLPRVNDCVMVGSPALFRGQRFKKVFVLGFNDGVLPLVTSESGVISDDDIDVLGKHGAAIEPKTSEVDERAESELLHVLASADRLFLSYSAAGDGAAPSSLLTLIARRGGEKISYGSTLDENARAVYVSDPRQVERLACCHRSAKRLFLSGLAASERPAYMSVLAAALGEKADPLYREGGDDYVLDRRYDIFFPKRTAYISQIQTFFMCPYRHFLQYGLRLRERDDGKLRPKDVGIILHRVSERYVADGRFDAPETTARELFVRVMREDFPDFGELSDDRLRRLSDESVRLCRTISAQFERSSYVPYAREEKFGKNAPRLKTRPYILSDKSETDIVGVMDRVDVCGDKARVIDYKTGRVDKGKRALSHDKLYYGTKFQLQFYAAVLRENGFKIGGMFYFPVGNNWSDSLDYCRMTGAFEGSIEGVAEHDKTIACGGKSEIINARVTALKKGGFSLGRNELALSDEKLGKMCDYALDIFDSGMSDIDNGFIAPLPFSDGASTACDYCPYREICATRAETELRQCGGDKDAAILGAED